MSKIICIIFNYKNFEGGIIYAFEKNIIRIFVSFVFIIDTLCSIVSSALAADIPTNQIDIYVNGKLIEKYYDNMRPFIDNNSRTQVPLEH